MKKTLFKVISVFCLLVLLCSTLLFSVSALEDTSGALTDPAADEAFQAEPEVVTGAPAPEIVSETPYIQTEEERRAFGEVDADIVEHADGTESMVFHFSGGDSTARSAQGTWEFHMDVSGDGRGNMTATVWGSGIKSCSLGVDFLYGTCRIEPANSLKTTRAFNSAAAVGTRASPTKITVSISTTKYFALRMFGTINGNTVGGRTSNVLYNKKAQKYPHYVCPHSGIYCVPPYYTNFAWTPSVNWNTNLRNNYIKWFEGEYGKPSWNWPDYHIHHIRQRNYGGQNINSNLIPLKPVKHTEFTNWWKNYA